MRWMMTLALSALTAPALAHTPQFKVQQIGGANVAVPVGWTVSQEAQPVPTIKLEERAGADDSPSVLIMAIPPQQGPQAVPALAQRLVQASMPNGAQVIGQAPLMGGAMVEYQGAITGIPAKLAVLAVPSPQGGGALAAFAAPTARYDALGGSRLLLTVVSGQAPGAAQPAPTPKAAAGALQVPANYRRSQKPTLDYLVDALETLSPGQVAQGLRQLNPTERQLLGIYPAFSNLLHLQACKADQAAPHPTGASCAQTVNGWRQTMQMLGNNWQAATTQAETERGRLQVAARCESGQHDAASCAAYRKTVGAMNQRSHETMMTIIRNLDSRPSCTPGTPGCVRVY